MKQQKFITKAEKTLETINTINNLIKAYKERQEVSEDCIDKINFLEEQLKHLEVQYEKYKETDEIYYEPNTYEYFKEEFSKVKDLCLDFNFIQETIDLSDGELNPSQKIKALNNMVKAYKERRT